MTDQLKQACVIRNTLDKTEVTGFQYIKFVYLRKCGTLRHLVNVDHIDSTSKDDVEATMTLMFYPNDVVKSTIMICNDQTRLKIAQTLALQSRAPLMNKRGKITFHTFDVMKEEGRDDFLLRAGTAMKHLIENLEQGNVPALVSARFPAQTSAMSGEDQVPDVTNPVAGLRFMNAKPLTQGQLVTGEFVEAGLFPRRLRGQVTKNFAIIMKWDENHGEQAPIWGAGLEQLVEQHQLKAGDRICVKHMGLCRVDIPCKDGQGNFIIKAGRLKTFPSHMTLYELTRLSS